MKHVRPLTVVAGLAISATAVTAGIAAAGTGTTAASSVRSPGWPTTRTSAAAARTTDAHDIVINAVNVRRQGIDVGPAGSSPGDYGVFEENLFSPATGKRIGLDSIRCMPVFTTYRCDGTFIFPGKGEVEISGAATDDVNKFSITGGTGNYRNGRGQLIVGATKGKTTRLTLQLLP